MIVQRGEKNSEAGNFLCGLPRDAYFMVCYTKSPKDGRRIAVLEPTTDVGVGQGGPNAFIVPLTRLEGSVR